MNDDVPPQGVKGGNPETSTKVEEKVVEPILPKDSTAAPSNGNGKKDSTSEVPMFDLEEVLRFVTTIHDKGLETAKMPEVAVGCGYKHASSTPFYRRLSAARLFGLLASSGPELTTRARDY